MKIKLTEIEKEMLPMSIEQTSVLVKLLPRYRSNMDCMSKAQLNYLYDALAKAMAIVIEAQLGIIKNNK